MNIKVQTHGFDEAQGVVQKNSDKMPRAVHQATSQLALFLAGNIRSGIRSGHPTGGEKFKPLAESTKKMKRSSKPLINHGDLLRSIAAQQVATGPNKTDWFIGVHRAVRAPNGRAMWNLAEIHEFGTDPFMIPVTPKLRGFWMAMAAKGIFAAPLHRGTLILFHPGVPARPFLRPPWEAFLQKAQGLWDGLMRTALGMPGGKTLTPKG